MGDPEHPVDWITDHQREYDRGDYHSVNPLTDHPAVRRHGKGVAPEHLADFIMSVARMSASRVQGIGAEQYGGEIQKFERMSASEIYEALLEEVADIFAYASFLAIKAGAAR